MDSKDLINKIKNHPEFHKAGMILCHNGVVRGTSRNGRKVSGLRISVDHQKLNHVLENRKKMPGIIDIQVKIAENTDLTVGNDVMFLVVAGDIRENVISAMSTALDEIKTSVTRKTEYFV